MLPLQPTDRVRNAKPVPYDFLLNLEVAGGI